MPNIDSLISDSFISAQLFSLNFSQQYVNFIAPLNLTTCHSGQHPLPFVALGNFCTTWHSLSATPLLKTPPSLLDVQSRNALAIKATRLMHSPSNQQLIKSSKTTQIRTLSESGGTCSLTVGRRRWRRWGKEGGHIGT